MSIVWSELPDELTRPLLKGGVGKLHLMSLAETALAMVGRNDTGSCSPDAIAALGCDMLLAAWEQDVLDGELANQLLALHGMRSFLPDALLPVLNSLTLLWVKPQNTSYLLRLLQKKDTEKTLKYIQQQQQKESSSSYWLAQAMMVGMYEGCFDVVRDLVVENTTLPMPIKQKLLGDVALLSGNAEKAVPHYTAYADMLPVAGAKSLLAEALYRSGDSAAACGLWQQVVSMRPWNIQPQLRLYDVVTGRDTALSIPHGKGAALYYTWNKAEYLDESLKALAESNRGGARIVVLDNGSTDATPDVLKVWQDRFGKDAMHIETLPLNIGAPAARNWLMHSKELADCDWVAYLDDDAMLPRDWLGRFGAAMEAYPDALAWGCKVVDHQNPCVLQAVDLHLDPGGEVQAAPENMQPYERRFSVSDIHHQDLDYGWFDYIRPCASVTGCTHMFLRSRLMEHGGFDLRFSPSQYDDLEHDLRGVKDGRLPVYTGYLRVTHMKRTGKAAHTDVAEYGNAYANMYKLQMKYSAEEFEAMRRHDEETARQDVLAKLAVISQ